MSSCSDHITEGDFYEPIERKKAKISKNTDICLSLKIFSVLFKDIHSHSGAKPPPKGLIKAKFTYFLHFFSFLDQTCLIDYDC